MLAVLALLFAGPAMAEDQHPLLDGKYWASVGEYFATRSVDVSASTSAGGIGPKIDFEKALGADDRPELLVGEFGWQFGEKWGLAMQYFRSERESSRKTLEKTIEWKDLVFEFGAETEAQTKLEVTRLVFSRSYRGEGPHRLMLAAGFHYIEFGAAIAGQVRLNDGSTEFRRGVVSTSVPLPNVGAWYKYSPSDRWLLTARVDWLSARVDDVSGNIWNAVAAANFRLGNHFGVGLAYQYFEIAGTVREKRWRGDLVTRFKGPTLNLTAFW